MHFQAGDAEGGRGRARGGVAMDGQKRMTCGEKKEGDGACEIGGGAEQGAGSGKDATDGEERKEGGGARGRVELGRGQERAGDEGRRGEGRTATGGARPAQLGGSRRRSSA